MKTDNFLCAVIGALIGAIVCGYATTNSWSNRVENQTIATESFIEMIRDTDADMLYDVYMETDEWAELSKYIEY